MNTFFGLPAHPFLVHIPVVLLPLAAIGAVAMVARKTFNERYRWAVLTMGAIGTVGLVLAAGAGERLEAKIISIEGEEASAGWESHAQAGELARLVGIVFFVALLAFIFVPIVLERRSARGATAAKNLSAAAAPATSSRAGGSWIRPVLAGLVVVTAFASVYTVVQAGHRGSSSVWAEVQNGGG
jgi:hypothetical protein